uniref:Uncharacterized protein n=1 Tax=Avena sativa TaxID=4498 RepID=A0ACD5Z9D8_AVESA
MQGRRNGWSRVTSVVRRGRSPARRGGSSGAGRRLRLAVHPAQWPRSRKRGEGRRILKRSASEPALWYDARVHPVPHGLSPPSPPPPPLERPHTCYDVFALDSPFASSTSLASSPPDRKPWEEAKVVVSVTVEGSAGPVKAMVRLGSTIREAIAAVVERYDREGRSPRLDPASADSFQLHHSHFCLESKPHSATTRLHSLST